MRTEVETHCVLSLVAAPRRHLDNVSWSLGDRQTPHPNVRVDRSSDQGILDHSHSMSVNSERTYLIDEHSTDGSIVSSVQLLHQLKILQIPC